MDLGTIGRGILVYLLSGVGVFIAGVLVNLVRRLWVFTRIHADMYAANRAILRLIPERKCLNTWKRVPVLVKIFMWPILLGEDFICAWNETDIVKEYILQLRNAVNE